jgi:hypothetical protein
VPPYEEGQRHPRGLQQNEGVVSPSAPSRSRSEGKDPSRTTPPIPRACHRRQTPTITSEGTLAE